MKTVQDIKNKYDPDLFIKMVMSDPAHIARSKVKAVNHHKAVEQSQKDAQFAFAAQWACLAVIGSFVLTVAAMLAMV